jgi:maleylpyruvate isomerase
MNHSFALGGCQKERQFGVIRHGYWRSSAAYRVRIVLNQKQLSVEHAFHHLRKNGQRQPDYLRLNPLGLVPALELDCGRGVLTQSLAICEWLKETRPEPRLLPGDPMTRAHIRTFALPIACDIHPLQNLKVLRRLRHLGHDRDAVDSWAHDVVVDGLEACKRLANSAAAFLYAAVSTLAEVPDAAAGECTVIRGRPAILSEAPRSGASPPELSAFAAATPEGQPDAEPD